MAQERPKAISYEEYRKSKAAVPQDYSKDMSQFYPLGKPQGPDMQKLLQEQLHGKPAAAPYTGETLTGFMQSQGMDFSYGNRKKVAELLGIGDYKGTAEQNMQMLKLIKSGALDPKTPDYNTAPVEPLMAAMPQLSAKPSVQSPKNQAKPSQEEVNNMMALLVNRFRKGGSLDPAHAIQKSPLKHPELPEELKLGALKCGGSMAKSKKPKLKPKKK